MNAITKISPSSVAPWLSGMSARPEPETAPAGKKTGSPPHVSRKVRRADPEHALQRAVAAVLDQMLPVEAWWTSVDHANAKSRAAGIERKRRGVKPGIPDVLIVWNGLTCWIELKAAAGRLSEDQQKVAGHLMYAGHRWAECRSVQAVVERLLAWGIPLCNQVAA